MTYKPDQIVVRTHAGLVGTIARIIGAEDGYYRVEILKSEEITAGAKPLWRPEYFELHVPAEQYNIPGDFQPQGQNAPVAGRKDDSGKLDMNLLDDMPRAMRAIVEVMQWAITEKKPEPYKRSSWLGVSARRYRAAIMRHNRDACHQATQMATLDEPEYQRDPETNLLHLAHMACSAMMALENTLRDMEVYKK